MLHRLLRVPPGEVPRWLCSSNTCTGVDAPLVLIMCAIGVSVWLFRESPTFALASIGVVLACAFALILPFETCERKARAKKRQLTKRKRAEEGDI